VLWVVVLLDPSSQVLALTGFIKTDFPGVLLLGTGTGSGPVSPPPHDKRKKTAKRLSVYLNFMELLFFD
jgi:hypothetical protein